MERANALLQNEMTTKVEPLPQPCLLPVAKSPQLAVKFHTAGMGSVTTVRKESTTRVTAFLQDKSVATCEEEMFSLSPDLSSAATILPQPRSMFQTPGKGTVISVSAR
jgi:hypothetical protein